MIGALVAGITGSGGASLSSYESIATATGTGSSGTITFSSIPSSFKHLQIRGIARSSAAVSTIANYSFTLNNVSSATYAYHALRGDGSTATASGSVSSTSGVVFAGVAGDSTSANIIAVSIIDILDYGSSTKNKTVRAFAAGDLNGDGNVSITSSLFINTNAITSIELKTFSGNWTTATTFALYGIKEA